MKRIFATMAAIVISAAVMTACGKTATENTVHSKADLEGKTIGVQLGTTGDSLASNPEVIKNAKVERYNKYADAVQALKQGKVDAVIIDSDTAKEFIKKNDDIELLSEELSEEEYAICMNLDNTALQVEINTVLTEFKTDGTLDTIKEYYDGANAGENKFKADPNADTSKGKLVMATNAGFPPYEYMEGQEIVGFDVDMMTAVCQKLGYELEIDDMEFDSIIPAVQSGKGGIPGYRARIRPIVSRITIHWPSFYNVVTGKTLALPNLIALQHIPLSPAGVIAKRPAPIALPNSCAAEWRMAPDAVFSPYASVRYFTPHMVHSQYNLL